MSIIKGNTEQEKNEFFKNFVASVTRGYFTDDAEQLKENMKTFKHYDRRIKPFLSNFNAKGLAVISILIVLLSAISASLIPLIISGVIVVSCESTILGRNIHNQRLMHNELKNHNKYILFSRKRQALIKEVSDTFAEINIIDEEAPIIEGERSDYQENILSIIKGFLAKLKPSEKQELVEIDPTPEIKDTEYTDLIREIANGGATAAPAIEDITSPVVAADPEPEKSADISKDKTRRRGKRPEAR